MFEHFVLSNPSRYESVCMQGRSHPQLAWALAQTQLQLSLYQAQSLLELLAFPADLPAEFCVNSAGNTFPADFAKDLGSQVR